METRHKTKTGPGETPAFSLTADFLALHVFVGSFLQFSLPTPPSYIFLDGILSRPTGFAKGRTPSAIVIS